MFLRTPVRAIPIRRQQKRYVVVLGWIHNLEHDGDFREKSLAALPFKVRAGVERCSVNGLFQFCACGEKVVRKSPGGGSVGRAKRAPSGIDSIHSALDFQRDIDSCRHSVLV